jgi:hypothetical protein
VRCWIVLGTKFKIVTGYDGGNNINGDQREVSGKANTTLAVQIHHASGSGAQIVPLCSWLAEGSELPDVPLLTELATNDEQHRIFDRRQHRGAPVSPSPHRRTSRRIG